MKKILLVVLSMLFSSLAHAQFYSDYDNVWWGKTEDGLNRWFTGLDSSSASVNFGTSLTKINISNNSVRLNGDSVIVNTNLHFPNNNDIWLGNWYNAFEIVNVDWIPIISYSPSGGTFKVNFADYNGTSFTLNDNTQTTTLQSYTIKLGNGRVYLGDYDAGNYGTRFMLDDNQKSIQIVADSITVTARFDLTGNLEANSSVIMPNIPSDSIGLSAGQIYYDRVTGHLKRKF
ncbi:MAG: hypothetical protein Kow0098_03730 [Ignavibacteriaceae bacterium]